VRRADAPSEISDAAEADLATVEALANLKFVAETNFDTPFAYLEWRQRCQAAQLQSASSVNRTLVR
jgi:hypothetical protein